MAQTLMLWRCPGWLLCGLVALPLSGCGQLYYNAEYDDATFTGSSADSYHILSTGELIAQSRIQHEEVAAIWVRFADGQVFELSAILEAEAASRTRIKVTDLQPGLTMYDLSPGAQLYYRNAKLCGATLEPGIGISQAQQGPFVELPLSGGEVRALMGEPKDESTIRGPMRWN